MEVYFVEEDGVRVACLRCPYNPIHIEKAEAISGDASAKMSVLNKMKLHVDRCPDNPDREISELDQFKKRILGI